MHQVKLSRSSFPNIHNKSMRLPSLSAYKSSSEGIIDASERFSSLSAFGSSLEGIKIYV